MKSKLLNYTIVLQKEPEGGYTVTVPALPGCVTYGNTVEEAKKMAIEAIELYLESLKEHNEDIPEEQETFYTQVSIPPSINHA
jgi:antitoxin HicB